MKELFIPKRIGRLEFFIFSLVSSGFSILLSVFGSSPLAAILFVPLYITYANARVKSWDGNADAWSAFLILFAFVSFGLAASGHFPPVALIFILIHLYLQLRQGKPSENFMRLKEGSLDRRELRRLKAEKKKLERKQEIDSLRKELDNG